jgi:TonB family protein
MYDERMVAQTLILLASLLTHASGASPESVFHKPQGLSGLGPPGGLLKTVDPKVLRFETQLLASINDARQGQEKPSLAMDERLRRFARREAELAATGSPEAGTVGERIKRQGLAPYGHYIQFSFGKAPQQLLKALRRDASAWAALRGDFARAGIGAFWIPDDDPGFQVAVLVARDPDPMAGKPGLSREQTDSVMAGAVPKIKLCYDHALRKQPNLRGSLLLQMVIDERGKVSEAQLLRGLGADAFDLCALAVARALQFPKPYKGKPVTLRHPMRLVPPQGDRRVGRLTDTQISGTFRAAASDFRACYDARAKAKPGLKGAITVAGTVATDGRFGDVEIIDDELADAALSRCVLRRAKRLRFPAPEHRGEVDVTFPVRFSP